VRVSLFMDPVPEQMAAAKAVGADRVELYTEPYAAAWGTPQQAEQLKPATPPPPRLRWMPAWA
jgi:pyridoxine 5-phosphate synthase